jgi:hypothetical protein
MKSLLLKIPETAKVSKLLAKARKLFVGQTFDNIIRIFILKGTHGREERKRCGNK